MLKKLACWGLSAAMLCVLVRLGGCGSSSRRADETADGGATLPNDAGWVLGDSGLVRVDLDGGVTIEEDGGSWVCYPITCAGHETQCGDCQDNDDDGLVDSRDPECLGPCDNTETAALLAGVGGETGGPCRADCYFDWGNGPGWDDCHWDSRCDPLAVAPDFFPEGEECSYDEQRVGSRDCPGEQSDTCIDLCLPLTPNGCDCFGCCTFPAIHDRPPAQGGAYVRIGTVDDGTNVGTCTIADVEDTSKCHPCTPVADCLNECGPCELCLGRTSLPPECLRPDAPDGGVADDAGAPPAPRCNPGDQPCGLPTDPDCPPAMYCITGCCVEVVLY